MLNLAGCSHFARHYFGNLGWFLFLQLLRCFSSPRSLCTPMYSVCNDPKVGFPHSEICGSMRVCSLPAAYRKLLRPSSPVIAKASTLCTYSLVPITLISVARDVYSNASSWSFTTTYFFKFAFARLICLFQSDYPPNILLNKDFRPDLSFAWY